MAKIKLQGRNELIEIVNQGAIILKNKWENKLFDRDEIITMNNVSFKAGDIRMIFLDEQVDQNQIHLQKFLEYESTRRQIKQLSPKEKAKYNAISQFNVFFWAYKGRKPEPNEVLNGIIITNDKILELAEKFYFQNPDWSIVSIKYWIETFGLQKGKTGGSIYKNFAWRFLENTEYRAVAEIENDKAYKQRVNNVVIKPALRFNNEFPELEVKNDIDVSSLPF